MRDHSFFDAPTADFYQMVRTMRQLGSPDASAPDYDAEIYPGDACRARP